MKTPLIASFTFALLFSGTVLAHSNNTTTNHSTSQPYNNYSHSNNYAQNQTPLVNINYNPAPVHNRHAHQRVTTNTATYYTRNYPVSNTYTYLTTPNTTIHQPPFAYSSCANRCDQTQQRITVTSNLGSRGYTYRAPSEYSAQDRYVNTPRNNAYNYYNRPSHTVTHVSPYKTHKITTNTRYGFSH